MIRRHGVIGGPRRVKPVSPRTKQVVKVDTSFVNIKKPTDDIKVIIVHSSQEDKEEMIREVIVPEIDYDSIEDDGPGTIEDFMYNELMNPPKVKKKRKKRTYVRKTKAKRASKKSLKTFSESD